MDRLIDTLWYDFRNCENVVDLIHSFVHKKFSKTYVKFRVSCLQEEEDEKTFRNKVKSTHDELHDKMVKKRVYNLTTKTYNEQGTEAWLKDREKVISASDAGTALGTNKYQTRHELIMKKCGLGPKFKGNIYTLHGHKYEDVAAQLYQTRNLVDLKFFGLVLHKNPSIPIGASPDGIRVDGRMLEIKVPMCREITGDVPPHYEVQTQVQMEVCELYENDFYELRIVEYDFKEDYDMDGKGRYTKNGNIKGMIGHFYDKKTGDDKYIYPPMWCTSDEMERWVMDHVEIMKDEEPTWIFETIIYWRVEKESCVLVKRDYNRMHYEYVPEFRKVWKEILHHRKTGGKELKDEESEEEEVGVDECVFDSDTD